MKVGGHVLVKVQRIPGQFLCETVTESCSKYLRGFTMSLRGEVEESTGRYVYCMLSCVNVCVCVWVKEREREGERESWVAQGAGSRLMGKGMLPAGSICPRVRHQTFTSTHQLFSALRCRSVSMPQWQTTKTWVSREKGIGGHRGEGERREDGGRKEMDDLRDGGRDCGSFEKRHEGGEGWRKTSGAEGRGWRNGGKWRGEAFESFVQWWQIMAATIHW